MATAHDRLTLVERVTATIRDQITSGVYGPGDSLPPEDTLATSMEVSRTTVRSALAQLTAEGLVEAARGRGRRVRTFTLTRWSPGLISGQDAWRDQVTQGPHSQRVELSLIQAPALVADLMQIKPGTTVVARRRVRFIDDNPCQTADSFYPKDIADGTPIMDAGDASPAGDLLAAAGHHQSRFTDVIKVRMASPDERARLLLPPVTAVAEHCRVGYDQNGRPVQVTITIVPGDRQLITYEIPQPA